MYKTFFSHLSKQHYLSLYIDMHIHDIYSIKKKVVFSNALPELVKQISLELYRFRLS